MYMMRESNDVPRQVPPPGTTYLLAIAVKWLKKWLLHSVSDISPTLDLF
jgi:hypothetical protein